MYRNILYTNMQRFKINFYLTGQVKASFVNKKLPETENGKVFMSEDIFETT